MCDTVDSTTYFQCPPGAYLNNTAEDQQRKRDRLQALQNKLVGVGGGDVGGLGGEGGEATGKGRGPGDERGGNGAIHWGGRRR